MQVKNQDVITPSCLKVLYTILKLWNAGKRPTYQRMQDELSWSSPGYLQQCVKELESRGLIAREKRVIVPRCYLRVYQDANSQREIA